MRRASLLAILVWCPAGTEAKLDTFPVQGFDYLSGNFKSRVFNATAQSSRTVMLRNKNFQIPVSVDTVTPSTQCSLGASSEVQSSMQSLATDISTKYSGMWSSAVGMQATVKTKLAKAGKSKLGYSGAGSLGYETGGSRDAAFSFARTAMMTKSNSVIKLNAKCEFAQVVMREPMKAQLSEDFLDKLTVLPNIAIGDWESAKTLAPDKQQYKDFLGTYGTHYVHTATLGGSYEGTTVVSNCVMLTQSKTASDYARCAKSKFNAAVTVAGPIATAITGSATVNYNKTESACNGITQGNSLTSEYKESSVETKSKWLGGNMKETDPITSSNVAKWLADVVATPMVWPKSVKSIPSLVYDLSLAIAQTGIDCPSCTRLKSLKMTKETLRMRYYALQEAMGDLFAEAYPADKVCTLKCGRCQTPADAACACPAQVKSDCSADVDKMSVRLDSIYVKAEAAAFGGELLVDIQIRLAGLGDSDGVMTGADDTEEADFKIGKTLQRAKGEFFTLDIYESDDGKAADCMGSIKVYFDKVGTLGEQVATSVCTNGLGISGDYTHKFVVKGCVTFPNSCSVAARTCGPITNSAGRVGGFLAVAVALVSAVLAFS